MQPQPMTPAEALSTLDQLAASVPLTRQQHIAAQNAAKTITAAIDRLAVLEREQEQRAAEEAAEAAALDAKAAAERREYDADYALNDDNEQNQPAPV